MGDQTLQIPPKLYGRESELKQLHESWQAARQGHLQTIFVQGHSGIGKSSLVDDLKAKVAEDGGLFLQGKQDQMERSAPFSTYLQAFRQLVLDVQGRSAEDRERWKQTILHAVGTRAQLLIDVLPELEFILEKQLPVEEVPPVEAQNRFNQVLLLFIEALSSAKQPLVLFLDDLQWADPASLQFTGLLATQARGSYMLLIGAYRDNEVDESHTLSQVMRRLSQEEVPFHSTPLTSLPVAAITDLLSETLLQGKAETAPLSEVISRITGGNPLFIQQYLKMLEEDRMLRYDMGQWQYDLEEIEELEVLEDAVDFIIRNMQRFDEMARDLLSIAAAIGSRFSLRSLALIAGYDEPAAMRALNEAVTQGSIQPLDDHYKVIAEAEADASGLPAAHFQFSHDKMQQAAYSLRNEEQREEIHYRIGKAYKASLGYAATESNVFEIVNQFNRCLRFVQVKKEKDDLARLNITAGNKARLSNAYDLGLQYFKVATELIGDDNEEWSSSQRHALFLRAAECAYLLSDHEQALVLFGKALQSADEGLEQAQVHSGLLSMHSSRSDIDAAWESGLNALAALKVNLPVKPSKVTVLMQLIRLKRMIKKRTTRQLLAEKDMESEEARLALVVLMDMLSSSWDRGQEVLAMVVLKGFEITLRHGNSPVSYFGYAGYGAILGVGLGKLRKGWEFIEAGGAVTEKYDSMFYHGRGNYAVFGSYNHLVNHIKDCIYPLEDTFVFSKEAGDYNCAANTTMMLMESLHVLGSPLNELEARALGFIQFAQKIGNTDYEYFHEGIMTCIRHLAGVETQSKAEMEAQEAKMQAIRFTHCRVVWRVFKLQNHCLLKEWDEARDLIPLIEEEAPAFILSTIDLKYLFYKHLAYLGLAERAHGKERAKYLRLVQKGVREAAKWSESGPQNYEQVLHILKGGYEEVDGKLDRAVANYDLAISAARRNGYYQNEAIARERKGRLLMRRDQPDEAKISLKRAYLGYRSWGAIRKTAQMEIEFTALGD